MKQHHKLWFTTISFILVSVLIFGQDTMLKITKDLDLRTKVTHQYQKKHDIPEGNIFTTETTNQWITETDDSQTNPWPDPTSSASPVENDQCINATSVGEVADLPFSTVGATPDGYDPGCGGGIPVDIWYLYTPASDGLATIDLCGSNFDTRLALWESCPDGIITSLICNDDGCGLQSSIDYPVSSGTSYYIQVGGFANSTGNGDLSIAIVSIPENDECTNPVVIPNAFPYTTPGTSIGASEDCPTLLGSNFDAVWYEIPVENAFNCIQIDYCGTVGMDLGASILMNDCLCDDYIEADFAEFDNCPDPVLHLEFYNVPGGPGQTVLLPALAEDNSGNPIDFVININVVPASTAVVNLSDLSKNLVQGQNGFEVLTIQNSGAGCNIDFNANIVNYTDAVLISEDFEGLTFPPTGWTLVNNGGDCEWYDQDALEGGGFSAEGNLTGSTGNFADADSDHCGEGTIMDTELRTPIIDLSEQLEASLSFYQFYFDDSFVDDFANVDVSVDGGTSWSTLISFAGSTASGFENLMLPVGSATTMIRFHYYAPAWNWYWQVDEVIIEASDIPTGWLSLNGNQNESGSVLAGDAEFISVIFNATGILPGTYAAQIEVLTSDPSSEKGLSNFDVTMIVEDGISLTAKAFLEGPYNAGGSMNKDLNTGDFITLVQPFNPELPYYGNIAPEWLYAGIESVSAVPGEVVDWVLVQVRDATDAVGATSSSIEAEQAAFVKTDGSIVGLDGMSRIGFPGVTIDNSLFMVVYHRNHLGIMSANPVTNVDGFYDYDFSTNETQVYGGINGHKELESGFWGMIAADGDGNGLVQNSDETDVWKIDLGSSGYLGGDFDMNGLVQNTDETDLWKPNLGGGGQVPVKISDIGYQSQIPK